MDQALLAFAVSAAVATIVAICIYSLSGDIVRNWVRRFRRMRRRSSLAELATAVACAPASKSLSRFVEPG